MTNRIQSAFDRIEASEELKSSTMRFLRTEREKRRFRMARPAWGMAFAAVCAVFVLTLGIGGYGYTVRKPVSYISIDVNPSVELALNRYDRVVSASAYNAEGESILESVNVKGQLFTDAIDTIVDSPAMQPYLAGRPALTFTVAANDSGKQAALLTDIENCPGSQKHHGRSYAADISSLSEAHESGLSLGKYAAYLSLSQYDGTVTTQDCRDMSMDEIHQQINMHERDGQHNGNGHSGFGHGYGHE